MPLDDWERSPWDSAEPDMKTSDAYIVMAIIVIIAGVALAMWVGL